MGGTRELRALRDEIERISRELIAESQSGVVSNADILMRIRRDCPQVLDSAARFLIDIALIKLVNDVSGRIRRSASTQSAFDLFGEIRGIPTMISVKRGSHRAPLKMTIAELRAWIRDHDAKAVSEKNKGLKQILAVATVGILSEDETLEAVLLRLKDGGDANW